MSTSTAHHTHQHLRGQTNAAKQAENSAPADTKAKDGHEERFRLIQVHAYGLWERAGKPNDDDSRVRCWLEAEKAIVGRAVGGGA